MVRSAHDCADGGLAVALAESAFGADWGVDVELEDDLPLAPLLFGEAQGRAVVSCRRGDEAALLEIARSNGVPASRIGEVGAPGAAFRIRTRAGVLDTRTGTLAAVYFGAIPRRMDGAPETVEAALESIVENP